MPLIKAGSLMFIAMVLIVILFPRSYIFRSTLPGKSRRDTRKYYDRKNPPYIGVILGISILWILIGVFSEYVFHLQLNLFHAGLIVILTGLLPLQILVWRK